jgi:hypothetical protein
MRNVSMNFVVEMVGECEEASSRCECGFYSRRGGNREGHSIYWFGLWGYLHLGTLEQFKGTWFMPFHVLEAERAASGLRF